MRQGPISPARAQARGDAAPPGDARSVKSLNLDDRFQLFHCAKTMPAQKNTHVTKIDGDVVCMWIFNGRSAADCCCFSPQHHHCQMHWQISIRGIRAGDMACNIAAFRYQISYIPYFWSNFVRKIDPLTKHIGRGKSIFQMDQKEGDAGVINWDLVISWSLFENASRAQLIDDHYFHAKNHGLIAIEHGSFLGIHARLISGLGFRGNSQ